jgi:inner membrane protein
VRGDLGALRELARTNCHFAAWMRFARAPLLAHGTATDIRFSASPRGNFTTLDIEDTVGKACPRAVPQWGFPRGDLLGY